MSIRDVNQPSVVEGEAGRLTCGAAEDPVIGQAGRRPAGGHHVHVEAHGDVRGRAVVKIS